MTAASRYRGQPVSEGTGTGKIYLGDAPGSAGGSGRDHGSPGENEVRAAFAAVARERAALAARLRERGENLQAGIVDIGALIAADPALTGPAIDAVRAGADGIAAVRTAAEAQAAVLAALPDPDLAQRAGDVRQVAEAVIDQLLGISPYPPPAGRFILVRREVDPADLIRLADAGLAGEDPGGRGLAGAVSVAGSGCPCWPGPTRRCWPPRPDTRRSSTPPRAS
jgi:phosphotransferase system enzyme I (PtsP)/phosphocarrier protein FPr/phosphocarrier protein